MMNNKDQSSFNAGPRPLTFDQIVSAAIQRCGSASGLARKWGMSHNTIARWASNETKPNADDLRLVMPRMDNSAQMDTLVWITSGTRLNLLIRSTPAEDAEGDMADRLIKGLTLACAFLAKVKCDEADGVITHDEASNALKMLAPILGIFEGVGQSMLEASRKGIPTRRRSLMELTGSCV